MSAPVKAVDWSCETQWSAKASSIVRSLGKDVLSSYLTVLVLRRSGSAGAVSLKASFVEALAIFVIRPRIAPLAGLIGFLKPFSETGLADLIADFLLSFLAAALIFEQYNGLIIGYVGNPAAPVAALRILGVGALLSVIPAIISLFLVVAYFMTGFAVCALLLLPFIGGIVGTTVYAAIPILAVIEIVCRTTMTIVAKIKKWPKDRERSWFEDPLGNWTRGHDASFRKAYKTMVISSCTNGVGNWMFFVSYLKLEGALFCPADTKSITTIWLLVPLAVETLYGGYDFFTE